jgi:hypothetical protein
MKLGIFAAAVIAALFVIARTSLADTITLHDLSHNTATGEYDYTATLDPDADVQTGDGFVIYDFPGMSSSSYNVSGSGSGASLVFNLIPAFTPTSNTLTQSSSVDSISSSDASINGIPFDNPAIPNVTFVYNGSTVTGAGTLTFQLFSSFKGSSTLSVYGSEDHSGPNQSHPYSFATNPITVPVPEPSALLLLTAGAIGLLLARQRCS